MRRRSLVVFAAVASAAMTLVGTSASASVFRWDADQVTPGANGGSGVWAASDALNLNWVDAGLAQVAWVNGNNARFTTGSGTVTISGTVQVKDTDSANFGIHVDDNQSIGYTFNGGAIELIDNPTIRSGFFGDRLTINSALIGTTGFKRTAFGNLRINSDNSATLSGQITITGQNGVIVSNVGALGTGNIVIGDGVDRSPPAILEYSLAAGGIVTSAIELNQGRLTGADPSNAVAGGTVNFAGPITVTGSAVGNSIRTANSNSSAVVISGSIGGTGGVSFGGDFRTTDLVGGPGSLTYAGDTRHINTTHFTNFGNGTTLPSTTRLLIEGTGAVNLNTNVAEGVSHTVAALSDSGIASVGNLTATQPASINVAQNEDTGFGGRITGAVSLEKSGTGRLTLSNTNSTHTGTTTVTDGTLALTGTLVNSAVTVNGGTLTGTGSIGGSLTVNSLGTLAPGNGIGTFSVGSAVLGGTLAIETDASTIDVLNVTGELDISAGSVAFNITGELTAGAVYVFANYGSVVGTEFASVTGVPEGWEVVVGYNSLTQIALVEATAAFVEGDADSDGDVDFDDLGILLGNYDLGGFEAFTNGDSDGDGDVDFDDLGLLLGNYGFGVTPAALEAAPANVVVPEPGMAGLIAPAAMLLARRRRA